MSSPLANVPIEKRRHLAATLGLFAVLFVAMGLVASTGRGTTAVRVFSAIALTFALLLGLAAWGVAHSIRLDLDEQRLEQAIDAAMAEGGGHGCGCGCDHDDAAEPAHPAADSCAGDGSGKDCSHSCDTCVMTTMRPSPTATRAERLRD